MKAMIFAAGLGTRLRPLTDHKPKALVEVGGKTLLEIQLEKLANVGFTDIVVNVHHFADQIKNFLNNYKDKDKINCRISDESAKLLNTGGGLKFAFNDGINEPVLIHNVDILSDANLSFLYETCKQCDAVLLVSERQTQRYLLFDNDMRMVGWTNIATGEVRSPYPDINVENCRRFAFAEVKAKIDDWIDYYNNDRYQWDLVKLSPKEYYKYVTTGTYPLKTWGSAPNPGV